MKYDELIRHQSFLDDSLLWCTDRAKRSIERVKRSMGDNGIWVIKSYDPRFKIKDLVDCLFDCDLDVFDIEFDTITRFYVCKLDAYRIEDIVVFSTKGQG